MFVCTNCGAHYKSEFLQCPQCGSTKRVTEAEYKTNASPIGFLVTLLVVGALVGIIAYGVYFLYNPVKDDNVISDIENIDTTTTTTETVVRSTTTSDRSTTTTTKLIGTESTPLGPGHTYTRPEGFEAIPLTEEIKTTYGMNDNTECVQNAIGEQYCIAIVEGSNFVLNSANKEEVNAKSHQLGFSDIISARLYGSTYYYYYTHDGENLIGGIYKNKGSNLILGSFSIKASEVNEESMYKMISIIGSVK